MARSYCPAEETRVNTNISAERKLTDYALAEKMAGLCRPHCARYTRPETNMDAHGVTPDRIVVTTAAENPHVKSRLWFFALGLAAITFVAYQPVWRAGFIWDDDDHLTANTAMTAPHGLRMIWSSLEVSRYYPLTLT